MKTHLIILLLAAVLLSGCENEEINDPLIAATLKPHPAIVLDGRGNDTAYLFSTYRDKGASVLNFVNGIATCNDPVLVSDITGSVNTRLPGTYFLNYNANDSAGNPLPAVTRTVHVVVNSAGFLNGNYNVACSCTAVAASTNPTVSTDNYTATVSTGSANNEFELVMLKIGPEYVVPYTSLSGNFISAGYFSPNYAGGSGSGTLSATKNTFTIESTAYPYSPKTAYLCKNVYTKQLILNVDSTYKFLAGRSLKK